MAAALGDFLRFDLFGRLFGQDILNVFYYRVTSLTGFTDDGYDALLGEFQGTVMDNVVSMLSQDFKFRELVITNVTNGVDFVTQTFGASEYFGEIESPSLPSYVCFTFRLQRETLTTRNGYKRFAGCPESSVSGNEVTANLAVIPAIEAGLASDLVSGLATLCEPVIVKRPLPTLVPSSHPYSSIGGCDFRGIGSQNTRKGGGWE